MNPWYWLVACGVVVSIMVGLPPLMTLLAEGGLKRYNYRREEIPTAVGLLPAASAAMAAMAVGSLAAYDPAVRLAAGIFGAALIGLLDDAAGNRSATGLRGHWRQFAAGRLSTGALKALFIPLLSLLLAYDATKPAVWVLLDGAIIAMSANMLNLLDVRPGRAIKAGMILLLLVLPALSSDPQMAALWGMIALAMVTYAPVDLQAKAMLGDSGANAFGLAAGWLTVQQWGLGGKIAMLAVLVGLHLLSERTSLSNIIDRSRLLRAVDRWGRQED